MLTREDVTDSTDWLQTPLAALASVESSLRCQVCKDFYATPMITSCSHTFCSLCIRRYLSQEGKCPACRESDQEIKLRRNWVVEELVERFQAGRSGILNFARSATQEQEERPTKRRRLAPNPEPERRSTRSRSKRNGLQNGSGPTITASTVMLSDSEDQEYREPSEDDEPREDQTNLVVCPICSRKMKEAIINSHLDSCIGNDNANTSSPRRSNTPQSLTTTTTLLQPKVLPTRERLPTINYSMLNDNALRKKLKDLGISSIGSKETMRKRHTEWVNLWNANCDARNPVSKHDLLRELNQWERTLGRQIDRGPAGVMTKNFDREHWQQTNKGDFDDLIAQARAKRASANTTVKSTSPPSTNVDSLASTSDSMSGPNSGASIIGQYGSIDVRTADVGKFPSLDEASNGAVVQNGMADTCSSHEIDLRGSDVDDHQRETIMSADHAT